MTDISDTTGRPQDRMSLHPEIVFAFRASTERLPRCTFHSPLVLLSLSLSFSLLGRQEHHRKLVFSRQTSQGLRFVDTRIFRIQDGRVDIYYRYRYHTYRKVQNIILTKQSYTCIKHLFGRKNSKKCFDSHFSFMSFFGGGG